MQSKNFCLIFFITKYKWVFTYEYIYIYSSIVVCHKAIIIFGILENPWYNKKDMLCNKFHFSWISKIFFFFLLAYKGWKQYFWIASNVLNTAMISHEIASALPMIHLKLASDSYQPFDVSRRTQDAACPISKLHFKRWYVWSFYCSVMLSSICAHTEPLREDLKLEKGIIFTFVVLGWRNCQFHCWKCQTSVTSVFI